MTLRLKPFEKSIRRRVRRELRQSPAAWKEYRRVRKRREFNLPAGFLRCVILVVVGGSWAAHSRPVETLVAITLLWAAASIVWRTGQLLVALRSSLPLLILAHVPIPDEDVFKFQWQTFLQQSAWSIADFTALYGLLADRAGYGWGSLWVGLFMAVWQWLVIVSVAALLLSCVRKWKFFRFTGVFAVLAIGAVALAVGPVIPSISHSLMTLALWIPPMGWILYAIGISPAHNILLGWWPALAMAGMLMALPKAYERLRTRYVLPEGVPATERVRGAVEAQRRAKSDGLNPDPCADLKAVIRTGEFTKGFNWRRGGWVERWTAHWLTPEERVAAEFLSAGDPSWTRGMVKSSLMWGGLAVLLYLVPSIFRVVSFFPYIFLFMGRGVFVKGWPGTALKNVSGSNMSFSSVYPLGFWQISRVCLKVNLARLAALLPFLLTVGYIALRGLNYKLGDGIQLILKVLLVILTLQLFSPIRALTAGTNDGTKIRMILLTSFATIILIGACVTLFFADGLVAITILGAILLGGSVAALLVYGHAYNHNWFDLQNKPKTTANTPPQ